MSLKKTLIIAVIFIALLTWYAWDQRRIDEQEAREATQSRLATPAKEALDGITLDGVRGKIVLERQGEKDWRIVEPIVARTEQTKVDALLREIDNARREDAFEPGENGMAEFGLETPSVKAEIRASGQNYIQNVELGSDTPSKKDVYARVADAPEVFTVSTGLRTQLTQSVNDLRDKRLLPANLVLGTTVTLAFDGQTFEAEKRDGKWALNQPVVQAADGDKIGDLLREWNLAKASDFIDSATLDLDALGLNPPAWTGRVYLKEDETTKTLTMWVGSPADKPDKYYAKAVDEPGAFLIGADVFEKLKPALGDLRSKELFTLTSWDVGHAVFNVLDYKIELVRDENNQWVFADDPMAPLDQGAIGGKLSELLKLKATRFIDEPVPDETNGLDRPNLRITISNRDGSIAEGLETGKADSENQFIYARLLGSEELLGVDWKEPGKFFLTRDELLDKALFRFDVDAVSRVELSEADRKIVFTRTGDDVWTARAGDEGTTRTLQGMEMIGLLYSATALEWKRRLEPNREGDIQLIKSQNLEDPERELAFFDASGVELGRLGQGGEQGGNVYVRIGADQYFAIANIGMGALKNAIGQVNEKLMESQ